MWGLIGLDADSQIEQEAGTLVDDRSKIKNWDLGDRLRSALTGVSRESIRKGVAEREATKINTSLSEQTAGITEALGGTSLDPGDLSIAEGVTLAEHTKKLAQLQSKGGAVTRYAQVDGADLSSLGSNSSTQQILKKTQDLKKLNRDKADEKAKAEKGSDREYAQGLVRETREYNKGLLEAENLRQDGKESRMLDREDRKDARASLERAETRKDNLMLRRDNMQLEYARLAQADRRSAQDRKDKALMTLISGLGNLGAAFTI